MVGSRHSRSISFFIALSLPKYTKTLFVERVIKVNKTGQGKLSNKSIPKTTNRQTELLVTIVPVNVTETVTQGAAPWMICTALRRTPPVTEATKVIVITKVWYGNRPEDLKIRSR